ncbi:uncharacterized protein LOC124886610 [Capsicum annuum]|uniref:uncharacterized protein LOC124886610 n=1 Tax=Capsicum annuum TaxID=4072 RepID=UPI001FB14936|nr:uncharacterized protein LOC124886610 [Capsicum annuum]
MAKVGKVDHKVKVYLYNTGHDKWARCHAPTNRGRMKTSNIAEYINGVYERQLHLLKFLKEARILFGEWNCKNREIASHTKTTLVRSLTGEWLARLRLYPSKYTLYMKMVEVLKSKYIKDMGSYSSDCYKPATIVKTYEVPIN